MVKPREMAKDPPPAESEEEESEEDETESEPEDAGDGKKNKSSAAPAPSAAKKESQTSKTLTPASGAASSSGEEVEASGSESDSGSDEDSPPRKSDFSVKPIASKSMTEAEKSTTTPAAKSVRIKLNASGPTSPTRKAATTGGAGGKRVATEAATPAETADSKRARRKTSDNSDKKVVGTPNVDEEKKLFARVFSEDDEIVLLNGILDFMSMTHSDPFAKINEFHEFISKKIGGDKTKTQVFHKMKRLKKRYDNHTEKVLKSGKERTLSNPHERNMYELSKKIWGSEENAGEEETSEGLPKGNKKIVEANGSEMRKSQSSKVANERAEVELKIESLENVKKQKNFSFVPDDGRINADWLLHKGIELMEEDDRIEMENKWKEFRLEEAELLIKKHNLMLEHMGKVRKSIKSLEK